MAEEKKTTSGPPWWALILIGVVGTLAGTMLADHARRQRARWRALADSDGDFFE